MAPCGTVCPDTVLVIIMFAAGCHTRHPIHAAYAAPAPAAGVANVKDFGAMVQYTTSFPCIYAVYGTLLCFLVSMLYA